jgi:peptidoglycan/LPS O-acetylase OafA/YrhL
VSITEVSSSRGRAALEVVGALVAIGGILVMVVNWFSAFFCLGTCSPPTSQQALCYDIAAVVAGLAGGAALMIAAARRARWALIWHIGMLVVAGVVAMTCFVPDPDHAGDPGDPGDYRQPPPTPRRSGYIACFSGSGHCPGDG